MNRLPDDGTVRWARAQLERAYGFYLGPASLEIEHILSLPDEDKRKRDYAAAWQEVVSASILLRDRMHRRAD